MPLRIIGTSHIAAQSIQEIKKAFAQEKPELVAVELDLHRASALFQDGKKGVSLTQAFTIGFKGYLFAKLGQIAQQKLGKMVGVSPGSEMKTALELAKEHRIGVAFIDQPLSITLRRFSKELTWRERFRFVGDLLKGLFFPKKQLKELGLEGFNLQKVPEQELIHKMMKHLKERYPNVYRTLVEERNKYMVKKVVGLLRNHPDKKILVIVGAGHKEGMEELLLKVDIMK
mgnify:CR=1 FL=1